MADSEYKDVKYTERVLFKGKVKVNPHSKNAEIAECCVTLGSVTIEATETTRIAMDTVEDLYVGFGKDNIRYRDVSGQSRTIEFEISVFDAEDFKNALETAQNVAERARLKSKWTDIWSSELTRSAEIRTEPARRHAGFFHTLKEKMRDKSIDRLCTELSLIGLDVRVVELGQLQEDIIVHYKGQSRGGFIEIRHSPIRLVGVLTRSGYPASPTCYSIDCVVPDPSVGIEGYLELKSVVIQNVPVFGKVVDIRWQGNLGGELYSLPKQIHEVLLHWKEDIVSRLEQDVLLKQTLTKLNEDIKIRSCPEQACWVIWSGRWDNKRPPTPSREQWECYETIARHLLGSSGK